MPRLAWSRALAFVALVVPVSLLQGVAADPPSTEPTAKFKVVRFKENPIIRGDMLPGKDGDNINGPSLIRVPDWLPKPLGKYYLYFAHHRGRYIRLAYADRLQGPWKIHQPGTLTTAEVEKAAGGTPNLNKGHIASPDVHVDHANKEIRMYFHGAFSTWGHKSGVATSKDGLSFTPRPQALGGPYFRVFPLAGSYYAIDRSGNVLRSRDGLAEFAKVRPGNLSGLGRVVGDIRHSAVKLDQGVLSVFFSRVGDAPESIVLSRIVLAEDPANWKIGLPVKVLEPELGYEGAKLPLEPSRGGLVNRPVRQLRDPAIYREGDKTYLLYSVAGEHGIAIAEWIE